jgi:hypothetical protein
MNTAWCFALYEERETAREEAEAKERAEFRTPKVVAMLSALQEDIRMDTRPSQRKVNRKGQY